MTITVSARGQMVIPASIRKRYGIRQKSEVELLDLGKEVVIVPIPDISMAKSRGILKGVSTDDLIRERRSLRKREHSRD
ncbi:AbrB/MazE/SpoVT family DNA-binding domain-containing protein [bacterium]|nr:MAG: AbrB/MazE/SpoVT family DNA-binding domain-containing protein [bacterium]